MPRVLHSEKWQQLMYKNICFFFYSFYYEMYEIGEWRESEGRLSLHTHLGDSAVLLEEPFCLSASFRFHETGTGPTLNIFSLSFGRMILAGEVGLLVARESLLLAREMV